MEVVEIKFEKNWNYERNQENEGNVQGNVVENKNHRKINSGSWPARNIAFHVEKIHESGLVVCVERCVGRPRFVSDMAFLELLISTTCQA